MGGSGESMILQEQRPKNEDERAMQGGWGLGEYPVSKED